MISSEDAKIVTNQPTDDPNAPPADVPTLTIDDLKVAFTIMNKAAVAGIIKADEMFVSGICYERFKKFMLAYAPELFKLNSDVAGSPEEGK